MPCTVLCTVLTRQLSLSLFERGQGAGSHLDTDELGVLSKLAKTRGLCKRHTTRILLGKMSSQPIVYKNQSSGLAYSPHYTGSCPNHMPQTSSSKTDHMSCSGRHSPQNSDAQVQTSSLGLATCLVYCLSVYSG